MFWAAFSHSICTELVPIDGDEASVRGGVTARVYLEVLKNHLETVIQPGDILIQDGAAIHTVYVIRDFFTNMREEMGITLMEWPPYSPDFNPIESLWSCLKRHIW